MNNELILNDEGEFPRQQMAEVMSVDAIRSIQEVQAKIIIAKKFPRCQFTAEKNVINACKRFRLSEMALYSYPRGGTQVTGPSIRLAEVLAQNWGNIDYGIRELEQREGESVIEAYAWDLETNVRQTKIFTVKHERKANKMIKKLDDPRDIYEMVANQGARRLRACILGIIPIDLIEKAVAQCKQTYLTKGKDVPIQDRIAKMLQAFAEVGVSLEMIEDRLKHKIDVITGEQLADLQRIFVSLRDGVSKRDDWFKFSNIKDDKKEDSKAEDLNKKFAKA